MSQWKDASKRKKIAAIGCLVLVLAFMGAVCWLVGVPMVRFVSEPQAFRAWVDQNGIWGRLAFVGMMAFQIIFAVIPGEPLEIGAGYAFGALEGTILCHVGILIGSLTVFGLVRKFGLRLVSFFFSPEKLKDFKFMQNESRLTMIAFILFLIPGTPKDIMTYIVGLTPMKLSRWLLISTVARIPSVVTSTIGGDALGMQNYQFAGVVFAVTIAASLIGGIVYSRIMKARKRRSGRTEDGADAKKESGLLVGRPHQI